MANPPTGNRWRRRALTFVKLVVVMPILAIGGGLALMFGGEALLFWDESTLRDWRDFEEEQRLEQAINRTLHDKTRPLGQPVLLSEIIPQSMRHACIEGGRPPSHVWLYGPTRKLMRQSYRPQRRPPFDDIFDPILAVEFIDGRVLGFLVPLYKHRLDFGTADQYVCAAGGRITFTREAPLAVTIRGD